MFLKCIAVFFLSMVPFIELRGGIPLGTGFGIPLFLNYVICILGNMIPVPFILFFAKKFLFWTIDAKPYGPICNKILHALPKKMTGGIIRLTGKFQRFFGPKFKKIMDKAESKAAKIEKYELFAVYAFVAVPLPGTGAWMGTLIASILPIRQWRTILAVFLGVVTSGIIMAILSLLVLSGLQTLA